jgi:hypothetical protein
MKVQANEFDGKVVYGQKRKETGKELTRIELEFERTFFYKTRRYNLGLFYGCIK